jgi:hypothetical protein
MYTANVKKVTKMGGRFLSSSSLIWHKIWPAVGNTLLLLLL